MSIEQFAIFISEQRKQRGLTQSDLAKKLNVTDKAVSKWERGLNYPDISTIEELAKVFDVTVLELLNGEKKMDLDPKEKESIDKAVTETLDFSKQLIKNQKRNYLNQGLILIIVFLLVLVGYQGYNQMFGMFGSSVSNLKQKITDLESMVLELQQKSEEINVYGNGVYYCYSPDSTFESIEFVAPDVIRVYAHAVADTFREAFNSYFKVEDIGKNKFAATGDVVRDDMYGDYNFESVKVSWGALDLFKVIEISEDHKTLYYGRDHSTFFCNFNSRPQ